ncbi:MAG: site-specific integrase [Campylobacterota bacterium]|nr:site-specific integrase [Campylobacterota bacterium]
MALKVSDYTRVKNESNLKIHKKDNSKFIFDFRIDNTRYRKTFNLNNNITGWDKKTCINEAKKELQIYKDDIKAGFTSSDKIRLDSLFDEYYKTLDDSTVGTKKKKTIYNRYIKNILGNKKICNITEKDVDKILASLRARGLQPKTIKGILEVMQPLYKFAVRNKYLKDDVVKDLRVKTKDKKKIVTGATELFLEVHKAITTTYEDEPFYQSFFLLCFTGRRVGEVINLKWENIDFINNYYWIEDTKNNDKQKYPLPPYIKKQLENIKDTQKGLVFKSPVTGKKIANYDRQVRQIKKTLALMCCDDNPLYQAYSVLRTRVKLVSDINNLRWDDKLSEDIQEILSRYEGVKDGLIFENLVKEKYDNFSPHYMRNILVSMLAEQGTEAITLSGILGHKDVNTINKYLSINHFKSGAEGLKKIDTVLDVEVIG